MSQSKRCPDCDTKKPASEYYVDRKRADALHTYCKACCRLRAAQAYARADKTERTRLHREWVRVNREHVRNYKTALALGVTVAEIEAIRATGKCAICGTAETLRVDHCHVSGSLRGLLCDSCNKGLGFFRDDPARLRAALRYLERG